VKLFLVRNLDLQVHKVLSQVKLLPPRIFGQLELGSLISNVDVPLYRAIICFLDTSADKPPLNRLFIIDFEKADMIAILIFIFEHC